MGKQRQAFFGAVRKIEAFSPGCVDYETIMEL